MDLTFVLSGKPPLTRHCGWLTQFVCSECSLGLTRLHVSWSQQTLCSTISTPRLNPRHIFLACQHVRECIANPQFEMLELLFARQTQSSKQRACPTTTNNHLFRTKWPIHVESVHHISLVRFPFHNHVNVLHHFASCSWIHSLMDVIVDDDCDAGRRHVATNSSNENSPPLDTESNKWYSSRWTCKRSTA